MKKINKKGDKIISVYWFAVLLIVAGAIVYMVFSFYGKPYDVRKIEADILMTKVSECVSEAGYLKEGVLDRTFSEKFSLFCGLNFQVEDAYGWKGQEQYFIELEFLDFDSKTKISSLEYGNKELKDFCRLKSRNFPVCFERSFYSLDKEGKKYQINIISIVKKTEKNV